MKRCTHFGWWATVMAVVVLLGGCQGLWAPRGKPGRAVQRFEFELIPDAVLVREDTTPEWQLGRYAFDRGADRVLVITRITMLPESEDRHAPLRDEIFERVWVHVPLSVALGQELRLEDLERDFLVGYDVAQRGTRYYIQPNKVLGTLTLLEERPGAVVAHLDAVVEPQRLPSWRVTETLTVPVTPAGRRAAPPGSTRYAPVGRARVSLTPPTRTAAAPSPAASPESSDSPPASGAAPWARGSLQGQWVSQEGEPPYRAQFEPNGRFTLEAVAAGEATTTRAGTYQRRGEYVVLQVERLETGGAAREVETPYLPLQLTWTDSALVLEGPLGEGGERQRVRLRPLGAPAAEPGAAEAASAEPSADRSVEGMWIGDTGTIELRLQFHRDGSFAYSSCRSGFPPGLMTGTWYTGGDYLIMNVQTYAFQGNNHMRFLEDDPTLRLVVDWAGDQLVLTGNFRSHVKQGQVRFSRTNFPDMREVLPPSRPSTARSR